MIEFVNSGGVTIGGSNAIYLKNTPAIIQQPQPVTYAEISKPITDEEKFLTPKERI